MLEGLREALGYVVELGNNAAKTEVVEIAGKTYARSGGGELERYDEADYAKPVTASTLTALSDYIENCHEEFRGRKMIMRIGAVRRCLEQKPSWQSSVLTVGMIRKVLCLVCRPTSSRPRI